MKLKKYLPPFIIAVLLLVYYLAMLVVFLMIPTIPPIAKVLLCVVPAAVCIVTVYVLIQRIREINSCENDDLDKY
ncbi:MAG: hypothetical protein E7672_02215 [Ruminococcaceae bacterium]|nr:hypothetical protein [Oscillospiraceae bacterium]